MNALRVAMSGDKPTFISTFAGTGGSSLGYHWAGFKELLAIECEDHAVECFKLNFSEVPIWQRDITTVTAKEILDFTGLKVGELDVFDGSPPCQGFSTAGKRQVKDPRNQLFEAYVQLVNNLQPKVFVMENVSGMAKGTMKGKFIEIIRALKSLNYRVKSKQMNAMYYGVPQSRERIIFMGIRNDLNLVPRYPIPCGKIISVKKAIGHLAKERPELKIKDPKTWDGKISGHFSSIRINPNRPSPTLAKTNRPNCDTGLNHYQFCQSLSIEEMKILCSFPVSWILPGAYSAQSARLGNAVMPKFMQAIAETIKKEILQKAVKI